MITFTRWMVGFAFLMIISSTGAYAQATRTWVSGVGDDVNPCSRTAPCKTFAGAIAKTAAGGEINAIDPGGYGAVTITKSITIDGGGAFASVLAAGGGVSGIVVNAGVNDVVILRNLDINGAGLGANGIRFIAGKRLYIENCTIYGFSQYGIDFEPSGASALLVDRTLVREAVGGGLCVKPGASGFANAAIANSRFENSQWGIRAEDRSEVTVSNSIASGNVGNGFVALATTGPVEINLENCVSVNNNFVGIRSVGAGATIRISNNLVSHNPTGVEAASGGSILSFSNNRIAGNTVNGTPSASTVQQ